MLLVRTCVGLAVVEISVQNCLAQDVHPAQFASMQSPDMQYQPLPGMQTMHQVPGMQTMHQMPDMQTMHQVPDMQMMHQVPDMQTMHQVPDMQYQPLPDMQFPSTMPELLVMQESPSLTAAEARPDDGSAGCKAQQAANPLHSGMSVLEEGRTYCSQAADSRWWDVIVKSRNCDGSYTVNVKDDVGTEWPVAQRAYFLDKPCNDFYREVLLEEGLSEEEIRITLQNQGFKEDDHNPIIHEEQPPPPIANEEQPQPASLSKDPVPEQAPPSPPPTDDSQQKQSRWPVSDRKMPMKVVAAAAAAGAVPLVYGLSGS